MKKSYWPKERPVVGLLIAYSITLPVLPALLLTVPVMFLLRLAGWQNIDGGVVFTLLWASMGLACITLIGRPLVRKSSDPRRPGL